MSDYNIPVSGGVNGLNVPLHGHIAVYNKEFPVIPNPEGEVTGYVTKLGFTPEILQVKDPEVHDWARTAEKPTYTKAEVGLGNVDNTSDLDKPISTATQTALDGKVDKVPGKALSTNDYTDTDKAIVDGVTSALATKVDKIAGKGLSTNDYTDYEKTKLAYIQSGAEVNVQVDWFEANRWSDAFILNKPTKLSDFSNDTGFITSTVDNLTYYYKKSETYTQAEVNALIGSIVTISFLVVQELPQTGEANIIYLVPAEDPNPDNIYEEYIYVNSNWEMIGTTKVDLSNYYTKTETDTLLNGKVDKDGDKVLSDNNYSDTDKTKLDGIEAEANKTIVDTEISATSTNPVESKAIYNLLNDLLPEAEVTGNPISITNASGFNAKALTVDMLPIQDLNGYDNPWVGGGGKNKFDNDIIYGDRYNGVYHQGNNYWTCRNLIPILPDTTYTFSGLTNDGQIGFYDENQTYISNVDVSATTTFTTPANAKYLSVYNRVASMENNHQLELGSSATSYAPYSNICPISGRNSLDITVNGNTETISLGETVYGGSCDVTTGVLTVKYLTFKLSDYTWNMVANNTGVFVAEVTPIKPKNYVFICEQFVSKNVSTSLFATGEGKFLLTPTRTYLYLCNKSYDNANDFMASINNVTLCYELANYQTIQLTPEQIELLKGNNTLSTSGDNMDLKYTTTISNPTSLTMARTTLSLGSPTVAEPTEE